MRCADGAPACGDPPPRPHRDRQQRVVQWRPAVLGRVAGRRGRAHGLAPDCQQVGRPGPGELVQHVILQGRGGASGMEGLRACAAEGPSALAMVSAPAAPAPLLPPLTRSAIRAAITCSMSRRMEGHASHLCTLCCICCRYRLLLRSRMLLGTSCRPAAAALRAGARGGAPGEQQSVAAAPQHGLGSRPGAAAASGTGSSP